MRPHAAARDESTSVHTPLDDSVACFQGASNSAAAVTDFAHSQGLTVRTRRRQHQQEEPPVAGVGGVVRQAPTAGSKNPHGLLGSTPLPDVLLREEHASFIMPDAALDSYVLQSWSSGADLGSFIKQEPLSLPNTSTLANLWHGGSGYMQMFSHQLQAPFSTMRSSMPDPAVVQRFLQTAERLKRRADVLLTAESIELERAARMRILQPSSAPSAPVPLPAAQTLLEPDPLRGGLGLGSPGSLGLMSCQLDASPSCYADVRLLNPQSNMLHKFQYPDL